MSRKPPATAADYMIVAINPALIMLLVGSVLFFLCEVFYRGQYEGRLTFICAMYVMGIVAVSRISMEEGAGYAAGFGAPLAAVVYIAFFKFVEFHGPLAALSPLLNAIFLIFTWWLAYNLTWDCTLLDDTADASGQGLLEAAGFDAAAGEPTSGAVAQASNASSPVPAPPQRPTGPLNAAEKLLAEKEKYERERIEERSFIEKWFEADRRPRAQGVWVLWFAAIALPIFGVMQWFVPSSEWQSRVWCLQLLLVYVGSSLALLLNTSFLSLRRYLRQRKLEMPLEMAGVWMIVGAALIGGVMLFCLVLPRPGAEVAISQPPITFGNSGLNPSRWGMGNDGKKQQGGSGQSQSNQQQGSSSSQQNSGQNSSQGSSSQGSSSQASQPSGSKAQGSQGQGSQSQGSQSQASQSQGSQSSQNQPPQQNSSNTPSGSKSDQASGQKPPQSSGQPNSSPQNSGQSPAKSPSNSSNSGQPPMPASSSTPPNSSQQNSSTNSGAKSPENGSKTPGSQAGDKTGDKSPSNSAGGNNSSNSSSSNPSKSDASKGDPAKGDATKNDTAKNEATKNDSAKNDASAKTNPGEKSDPSKTDNSGNKSPEGGKTSPGDPAKTNQGSSSNSGASSSSSQNNPSQSQQSHPQSSSAPPSPPPTPPRESNFRLPSVQIPASLGNILKLLLWGALAVGVVYALIRYREQIAAAWKQLLDDLAKLWARLFGGGEVETAAAEGAATKPTTPPRPFASYPNPFTSGLAARMPPPQLMGHTLAAAEAFGRERGFPRDESETPHEYLARLFQQSPEVVQLALAFAETYGQVAFGKGAPPQQAQATSQRLWQVMSSTPPPPPPMANRPQLQTSQT